MTEFCRDTAQSLPEMAVSAILALPDQNIRLATLRQFIKDYCVLQTDPDNTKWYYLIEKKLDSDPPTWIRHRVLCYHWKFIAFRDETDFYQHSTVCSYCGQVIGNKEFDTRRKYGATPDESPRFYKGTEFAGFSQDFPMGPGGGGGGGGHPRPSTGATKKIASGKTFTLPNEKYGYVNRKPILAVLREKYHSYIPDDDCDKVIAENGAWDEYLRSLSVAGPLAKIFMREELEKESEVSELLQLAKSCDRTSMDRARKLCLKLYPGGVPIKSETIRKDLQDLRAAIKEQHQKYLEWALVTAIKIWFLFARWPHPFFQVESGHRFQFPPHFNTDFDQRMMIKMSCHDHKEYVDFEQRWIASNPVLLMWHRKFLEKFHVTSSTEILMTRPSYPEPVITHLPLDIFHINYVLYPFSLKFVLPCAVRTAQHFVIQETVRFFNGHYANRQYLNKDTRDLCAIERLQSMYLDERSRLTVRTKTAARSAPPPLPPPPPPPQPENYVTFSHQSHDPRHNKEADTKDFQLLFDQLCSEDIKSRFSRLIQGCSPTFEQLLTLMEQHRTSGASLAQHGATVGIDAFLECFGHFRVAKFSGLLSTRYLAHDTCSRLPYKNQVAQCIKHLSDDFSEFTTFANRVYTQTPQRYLKGHQTTTNGGGGGGGGSSKGLSLQAVTEVKIFSDQFSKSSKRYTVGCTGPTIHDIVRYLQKRVLARANNEQSRLEIVAAKNLSRYFYFCYLTDTTVNTESLFHTDFSKTLSEKVTADTDKVKLFFYFYFKKFGFEKSSNDCALEPFQNHVHSIPHTKSGKRIMGTSLISFSEMQENQWLDLLVVSCKTKRICRRESPPFAQKDTLDFCPKHAPKTLSHGLHFNGQPEIGVGGPDTKKKFLRQYPDQTNEPVH